MKLSTNVIRILTGLVFSVLGFLLAERYLTDSVYLNIPREVWMGVITLLTGAFALYILPVLIRVVVVKFTIWLSELVQMAVSRLLSEFVSQIPKIQRSKEKTPESQPIVLDTSVIIDGRIIEIVKAGFIWGILLVPKYVLEELQSIADSAEPIKRNRGRYGLTVLEELKKCRDIRLKVINHDRKDEEVDAALITLAKERNARIASVDFNLNKVANLTGVRTLNINMLVNALKTVVIPGEFLTITVIQDGKEKNQGVGYLDDGTLIVVEEGRDHLGKEVEVEVARILQTSAGKMVFAKIK